MTFYEFMLEMGRNRRMEREKELDRERAREAQEKKEQEAIENYYKGYTEEDVRPNYRNRSDGTRDYFARGITAKSEKEWRELYDRRKKVLKMLYDGKTIDEIGEIMKDELEPSFWDENGKPAKEKK